jgi:hypothetical protein
VAGAFSTVNSTLSTIAGYIDTEVAAIKLKTDNIPASPAAASDCITAAGVRTAVGLASANLDTQLDALPTNAELTTALAGADDATLAAIAALNNLSQANVRTAIGLASANLDTQLDALPTNAELVTALATADDATLAAVTALNNLSSAQAQTAAAAALAAYDVAKVADVPTGDDNADALLKRDWTAITGEASRSVLNALRFIRNRFSTTTTPGSVDVFKEDDTTPAYSKSVTTNTNADPIVEG